MAFNRKFFALATSHGNVDAGNLFQYKSADSVATVVASAYFLPVTADLAVGDFILVGLIDGTDGALLRVLTTTPTAVTTVEQYTT